jgi:hypothetical protein
MKPQITGRHSVLGTVVTLAAVLILGIAIVFVLRSVSTTSLPSTIVSQTPLQTSVPNGYPPPPSTQQVTMPPRIATSEAIYEQTMQAFRLTITPATTTPGIPPTPTLAPFIPGIYNSKAAPEPSANHTMTNWWQDLVNGERVQVFAGALQDNTIYPPGPAQGVVVVNTVAIDVINSTLQEYDAPSGTGVLTITAVSGSRLTLQSDNGGTLYFDVPTRQFVDSLSTTSAAPTATLLPTILPDIEAPSPTAAPYPYPQQTTVATSAP